MEAASVAHGAGAEHEHHGPPPAHRSSRVEPQLLGMLLFIISEVMIFGAFFTAYFFIRVSQGDPWPAPGTTLPVEVAGVNTARSEEHRLNSSHGYISYAVFCLKKKKNQTPPI